MAGASRTINPLHFEDLEPHRFEDLVRQLVYDYRDWKSIEATGRAGSDDGFDVRAWENVYPEEPSVEDDENEGVIIKPEHRIWLIQCKREKTITPKKLEKYVQDIKINPEQPIYGAVFVASCDFSKKSGVRYLLLIETKLKEILPNSLFKYSFLDVDINANYRSDNNWRVPMSTAYPWCEPPWPEKYLPPDQAVIGINPGIFLSTVAVDCLKVLFGK